VETVANQGPVTRELLAWRAGDEQALERLTALVYQELRRLAAGHMAWAFTQAVVSGNATLMPSIHGVVSAVTSGGRVSLSQPQPSTLLDDTVT